MKFYIIIIFLFAAIVSYKRAELGIVILLLFECTFNLFDEYKYLDLYFKLSISDVILLSLVLSLLTKTSFQKTNFIFNFHKGFTAWIALTGVLSYIVGFNNLIDAMRMIIKYAPLWLIPLVIALFTYKQQKIVSFFIVALSSLVVAGQLYAMTSGDAYFIEHAYYQYSFSDDPELYAQDAAQAGFLARFFPAGYLFVQMSTGFLIGQLCSRSNLSKTFSVIYAVLIVAMILLSLSTGSRSSIIIVFFTGLTGSLMINKYRNKLINLAFRAAILAFLIIFLLFITNIFSTLSERLSMEWDQAPRTVQNIEAIHEILFSPIFGIGSPYLLKKIDYTGTGLLQSAHDVNGFISLALMGGIPAVIAYLYFVFRLVKRYFLIKRYSPENLSHINGCILAVAVGLFSTLINVTPVFGLLRGNVPLVIFTGLLIFYLNDASKKIQIQQGQSLS